MALATLTPCSPPIFQLQLISFSSSLTPSSTCPSLVVSPAFWLSDLPTSTLPIGHCVVPTTLAVLFPEIPALSAHCHPWHSEATVFRSAHLRGPQSSGGLRQDPSHTTNHLVVPPKLTGPGVSEVRGPTEPGWGWQDRTGSWDRFHSHQHKQPQLGIATRPELRCCVHLG